MTPAEAIKASLSNAILRAKEAAEDIYPAANAINPRIHRTIERTEGIIRSLLYDALVEAENGEMALSISTGSIHVSVRVYDRGDEFHAITSIDVTSHKDYGTNYGLS